ncbi:MAG: hypothetical protein WBB22_12705 [Anaerolineae bacterium]
MAYRERWIVVLIASLTVAVTSVPYILGYASAPADMEFSGVVMNFGDSHGYLAKMRQGAEGNLFYQIPFTSEDHEGAFVGGFFLALGWVCAVTGMPVIWMWHLSRVAFGFLLLLSSYLFITFFLKDQAQRLVCYLLVCFSAGFGWIVLLTGRFTILGFDLIDFKMPEAHIFFTILTFPHFAVGANLLLVIFILALLFYRTRRLKYMALAGAAGLMMGIVHPYNMLIVACTLGIWLLLKLGQERRFPTYEAAGTILLGLIALPPFAYYLYVFSTNPAFGAWAAQSGSPSPHPVHYLLGYGPLLILAVPSMVRLARKADEKSMLPLIWVVVVAVLIYAPLKQQRRMVEGVHIPLSVLATTGLYTYYLPRLERSKAIRKLMTVRRKAYSRQSMRNFIVYLVLVITVPSNLYILASLAATASQHPYPFFHERAEIEAIEWLGRETEPTDTVLAAYGTGSYIPSRINHRVFAGYWAETAEYEAKIAMVDRFFRQDTPDSWRMGLLEHYRIAYLFYGPREATLGVFDPRGKTYLSPSFANQLVTIYRVQEPER